MLALNSWWNVSNLTGELRDPTIRFFIVTLAYVIPFSSETVICWVFVIFLLPSPHPTHRNPPPTSRNITCGNILVGVCGEAGFVDQTELSWLKQILSWQAPSGCYYQFDHENLSPENFKPHMYGSYRRRKRAEKRITGAESELCLAHRTAVALLAMQSFLVRFIETLHGLRSLVWTD